MKLITFIFTLFLFISCEDDKAEEKVSCNEVELYAAVSAEYGKLFSEFLTVSGVTQATCTSTKAAIQELRGCMSNDSNLKTGVDAYSDWTNSVCN